MVRYTQSLRRILEHKGSRSINLMIFGIALIVSGGSLVLVVDSPIPVGYTLIVLGIVAFSFGMMLYIDETRDSHGQEMKLWYKYLLDMKLQKNNKPEETILDND